MVLYLDRINKNYLVFYDETNKKYDINMDNVKISGDIKEGQVYITDDFYNFSYSKELTENKKNEILQLQKKLFNK